LSMAARVFVLMPTFNIEAYIPKAIESVMAQTYTDWELLILDDCSTDNTSTIVEPYLKKDARIKFLKNEHNLGMLANWNLGITFCQSPYFAKLDGDDYWHPEMIAKALNVLEQDEATVLVFSKYVNIDGSGRLLEGTTSELPDFAKGKSFSCIPLVQQGADKMLSYPVLRQGLSLLRSRVFEELGGFRYLLTKQTQASTDTEFYFRVGCHYQIHCIDQVLYYYRVHEKSISALNQTYGLSALKIFEVKMAINNYYFQEKKIDHRIWNENKSRIGGPPFGWLENYFYFTLFILSSI
jgi:glycosyltransferase involved in cell wall biosynthesis